MIGFDAKMANRLIFYYIFFHWNYTATNHFYITRICPQNVFYAMLFYSRGLFNSMFEIISIFVASFWAESAILLIGLVMIGSRPHVVLCDLRCACKFDMHENRRLQHWHRNRLWPVCSEVCVNKLSRCANDFSQYSHRYGFSPLWHREWIFSWPLFRKDLPQVLHT